MYAVARRTDRSGRGRTAGEHEVMFDWVSALKPDSSAIYIPHEYRPIGSKPCRWRWLRLNAELRGRGEAPAMYSGTARRRAALEDPGCLIGVLGLMPGCGRGLRRRVVVATMRSLLSVTPRTLRRDRARNRLRTAADGDAPRRSCLELCRYAQQQILAPSAATSWTPTGSPPAVCPIGRLIAGWPVTLNGAAKHQMRSNRGRIDSGSAGGGRSSSRRAGDSPAAGVRRRSKSFAHHADPLAPR